MNLKIRAQLVVFNKAADWLICVKFQRGFKVTIKSATCIMYKGIMLFVFVHFFEVLKYKA